MDNDEKWKNNGQGVQSDRPTDRSKKDCWGNLVLIASPNYNGVSLQLSRSLVCSFVSPRHHP